MRKLAIVVGAGVLIGLIMAAGGRSADFEAKLTGASEVPPVATDTSGMATFDVTQDGTLRYKLRIVKAVDIFGTPGAHIHCGGVGVNGPVAVFLAGGFPVGGPDGTVVVQGTLGDEDVIATDCGSNLAELAAAMAAGDTYVNVHSVANAAGEVRGQIEPIRR